MTDSHADKPQQEQDPKIIVDEGWKGQVQAEKNRLKQEGVGHGGGKHGNAEHGNAEHGPIPEASFPMLVTTLATQATVALGQMAAPDATEVPVDLALAKHLVDTLAILDEKTKGNLSPEESQMLTNVLHQLRMLYVAVQSQAKPVTKKESSIELP